MDNPHTHTTANGVPEDEKSANNPFLDREGRPLWTMAVSIHEQRAFYERVGLFKPPADDDQLEKLRLERLHRKAK